MSSDTSTTRLSLKKETSFGTLPALAQFRRLRFTGESLAHKKETVQSSEITDDRQVSDLVKVNAMADGAVNFEFSILEYLELILGALGQTAWTTVTETPASSQIDGQNITGTIPESLQNMSGYIVVSGATNPANNGIKRVLSSTNSAITCAAGSFVADETVALTIERTYAKNGVALNHWTLERGVLMDDGESRAYQWYKGMTVATMALKVASKEIISGSFGFQGQVGGYKSRSLQRAGEVAATGTLTLTGNVSSGQSVTIGVGTGQKVYPFVNTIDGGSGTNEVKVGATASESLDNLIAAINGGTGSGTLYGPPTVAHTQVTAAAGAGDTMVVTAKLEDQTGTFGNTIVTSETLTNGAWGAATLTGGEDADPVDEATTGDILNGTNNVTTIASGETALSDPAKEFSFTVNNNLRPKDKIGLEGAFEMGQGQFNVTGNLNTYFEDNTLFQKIVDHEDVALSILLNDTSGNYIGITFPRVKLATGNPNTGSNNADVMMSIDWTAIKDPTTGATMIVDYFAAA